MRCVLATKNRHKCDEIADIFGTEGLAAIRLSTLLEFADIRPAAETGRTFLENARIKALHAAHATAELALADDSGLVVEALGGAPGVHSARYAGPDASDADRIHKLLDALVGVPDTSRSAHFVCAMVLARGDDVLAEVEGTCQGQIASAASGDSGFGYDPVFYVPEYGKTMSELGPVTKNRISHRARAVRAMAEALAEATGIDRTITHDSNGPDLRGGAANATGRGRRE